MRQVHWYPGHINKAIKELEQKIKKVDLLIVLLDARAPFSTYLPYFDSLAKNKHLLIVLTKEDLAPKKQVQKAKIKLSNKGKVISMNLKKISNFEIRKLFKTIDTFKFKALIPKIIILGVPNVGKSTLINFLAKQRKAKAEDRAGVTRTTTWFKVDKYFIMDTPGVLEPRVDDININYRIAAIGSMKQTVLPIEELGEYVLAYLIKANKIKWEEDFENELSTLLDKLKISKEKYFTKLLKDFQTKKYQEIYLEDFNYQFNKDQQEDDS